MWEPKLAQNSPFQGWEQQEQGGWCPPTAVRMTRELTEVLLARGNCFEMKTSTQERRHLSTKFQTNKTLLHQHTVQSVTL